MNCSFKISRLYYTVEAIKSLLASQGIRPAVVDKAVEKTGFVIPGPHETLVDPAAEKTLINPFLPVFNKEC